tara:strand:- start:504 stop:863 length:360 start_codon:yes stop_codon:yes gene_type:complete
MKRRILINVDESTKCRFGAINCLQQATTRNDYDVPMCRNCFNIWDKLRDRNTAELTNGKKVQIPMSLIGDPHNDDEINAKQDISWDDAWLEMAKKKKARWLVGETDDDEPTDEFYCGEY